MGGMARRGFRYVDGIHAIVRIAQAAGTDRPDLVTLDFPGLTPDASCSAFPMALTGRHIAGMIQRSRDCGFQGLLNVAALALGKRWGSDSSIISVAIAVCLELA